MLGKKLGIDLGTATTRVMTRSDGLLVEEPSVVAPSEGDAGLPAGRAAIELLARDPTIRLTAPLRGGDVADRPALDALLLHVINRAVGRQRIFKPDLVITVRAGMGGDDRRAVLEASARAGSRTVYLIDACIAAAVGAGVAVASPRPHLVVDAGAGKTDVAVLAQEGTLASRSLPVGTGDLVAAVTAHVAQLHAARVTAAEMTAVTRLLVAAPHEERTGEVAGVLLSSHELAPLVAEHLRGLDGAVRDVLDETPAALRRDVKAAGVLLTGGGALLEGLDRHVAAVAGCSARAAIDPLMCCARGAATAVDNLDVMRRNFMYIR